MCYYVPVTDAVFTILFTFLSLSPFNDVTGTHSLVICGRKAPSLIINSGTNELWLKFHADSQKDANQIGFRAKFSSVGE